MIFRAEARFADAIALVESSRDKSLLATMNRRWADRLASRRLYRQASHRYRVALGVYRQRGDAEGAAATTRGTADLAVAAGEQFSAEALFDQADLNTTTAHEHTNRLIGRIGLAIAARRWESIEQMRDRILRIGLPGPIDRARSTWPARPGPLDLSRSSWPARSGSLALARSTWADRPGPLDLARSI